MSTTSTTMTEDERMASYTEEIDSSATDEIEASNAMYDRAINEYGLDLRDADIASREWESTQTQNQQERYEHTVDVIEQQKEQAEKDYIKEQSGAYVDWQKQSNQYGANAERMASAGLAGTGYSESSQVSMYNTYQNRISAAREVYSRAVLDYDNAIKEASLQNNSILAEIAFNSLQSRLELSLQYAQYKNTMLIQKAQAERDIRSNALAKWKAVYDQINTENAQAEDKRQFDETMTFNRDQLAEEQRQFDILHPEVKITDNTGGNKSNTNIVGAKINIVDKIDTTTPKFIVDEETGLKLIACDKNAIPVQGLNVALTEGQFNQLYKRGLIVEHEQDGYLVYKTTVSQGAIEATGIIRNYLM